MRKPLFMILGMAAILIIGGELGLVQGQSGSQITTNKDKCLTIAVQGKIAPSEPGRSYTTTWDGKPKMAIGIGGINYNLKIGGKIFGWAGGDRATMGVATVGVGEDGFQAAWTTYASIGNEVKVLGGEAKGAKGVVIAKFGSYVLIHFPDDVLNKLTIGTTLQAKTCGLGLEIKGFNDVMPHGVAPEVLEKLVTQNAQGQLEAPVVKEIPAQIMGQGAGRGSLSGNWHIQTCYPPDIEKYGLDELRFGDLVLLKDIQTDYGMGYYKGGATLGVVCSGPSDISGLGIGVTPILSTRTEAVEELGLKKLRLGDVVAIENHYDYYGRGRYEGAITIGVVIHGWSDYAGHGPGVNPVLSALPGKIKTRIDPHANTAYYLGIRKKPSW